MIHAVIPLALVASLVTLTAWRMRRHYIKHRWGGEPSPGIRSVATTAKICALTFDDGPDPETTPMILDTLKNHGVHATFFMVGANVRKYPEIVRRIHQDGHDLGNHTYSHTRISFCSAKKMLREIDSASQALRDVTAQNCRFFRPPHGRFMGDQKVILDAHANLETIMWDVCPNDWELTSTQHLLTNVQTGVNPGSIILLHDVNRNTAHSMDALILMLKDEGYRCLSISELLSCETPSA